MSKLQEQLDARLNEVKGIIPAETLAVMGKSTEELKASGIEGQAALTGDKAPEFTLSNHMDEEVTLSALLKEGPVVVSFYRGGW